jgi:hypothetical protein
VQQKSQVEDMFDQALAESVINDQAHANNHED